VNPMTTGDETRALIPFPERTVSSFAASGRIVSAMVVETLSALRDTRIHLDTLVVAGKRIWRQKRAPDEDGMTKENIRAFEMFLKAAEGGHPEGQYLVSLCNESGSGIAPDQEQANEWLRRAAFSEFAKAQFRLGVFLWKGLRGFQKEENAAFELLTKAADDSDYQQRPAVWMILSEIYESRDNVTEVLQCHRKCVETGEGDFIYSGYELCVKRRVLETDMVEAYSWFQLAAEETLIADARQRADELIQMMAPAEVAKAAQLLALTHSKFRANR